MDNSTAKRYLDSKIAVENIKEALDLEKSRMEEEKTLLIKEMKESGEIVIPVGEVKVKLTKREDIEVYDEQELTTYIKKNKLTDLLKLSLDKVRVNRFLKLKFQVEKVEIPGIEIVEKYSISVSNK
jgi:hypothetical protein